MRVIEPAGLGTLWDALYRRGYTVVGPTVRDGAIVYGELASPAELPAGWTDHQEGGSYRLKRRTDGALFGYAVGPHSWKRFLHPPAVRLWRAERDDAGGGFRVLSDGASPPPLAFIGVRACELAAIAIQDRVFLGGPAADPVYAARRRAVFLVAVQCGEPGGTCFCASMGTGPQAREGFDLALTEVIESGRHHFTVEAGSPAGEEVLAELGGRDAGSEEVAAAERVVARTAGRMGRSLDTAGIQDLFARSLEHPRWQRVAERCLACGNCTMVCPTCFCTTVEDASDLAGRAAERWRRWDSCFTLGFSYLHGGSVRRSTASRYRQWITHKLATWHDQFGTSGCVGCGRCITWCPVGIDITEEVRALREAEGALAKEATQ